MSIKKWKLIENAVAALYRAKPRWEVIEVLQRAEVDTVFGPREPSREVDVVLRVATSDGHRMVGIDVKDEARAVDRPLTEQCISKAEDLPIDEYVLVSTSGFTAPAREKAKRKGVETIDLRYAESLGGGSFRINVRTRAMPRVEMTFAPALTKEQTVEIQAATGTGSADDYFIVGNGSRRSLTDLAREKLYGQANVFELFQGPDEHILVLEIPGHLTSSLVVRGKEYKCPARCKIGLEVFKAFVPLQHKELIDPDGVEIQTALWDANPEIQLTTVHERSENGGKISFFNHPARPEKTSVPYAGHEE